MQGNNRDGYHVPESFLFPPFFTKKATFKEYDKNLDFEDIVKNEPFYFDMLYLQNVELTAIPWENSDRTVPAIIEQWKKLKPKLHASFTQRNANEKNDLALIHALSLFIVCLFWTNDTPVKGLHEKDMMLSNLKLKPVNCKERLSFVINKPTQYHSFVQLQQLFDELEKTYHKAQAIKRS